MREFFLSINRYDTSAVDTEKNHAATARCLAYRELNAVTGDQTFTLYATTSAIGLLHQKSDFARIAPLTASYGLLSQPHHEHQQSRS